MLKKYAALGAAAVVLVAGCGAPSGTDTAGSNTGGDTSAAKTAPAVSFESDILPIFEARCQTCHIEQTKGRLSLATLDAAMTGGKAGSDIVPGDPEGSLLYKMVAGMAEKRMPPKGDPLTVEQIATIRSWIEAGAH